MKQLFPASLILLIAGAAALRADIAYTDSANQGNIDIAGNIALLFNVDSPISVTALGAFTANGSGTFTTPVDVVIYNTGTNTAVTPVATFQGSYAPAGLGFDVFQAITPVTLAPGSYEVDEIGLGCLFNCSQEFGNQAHGSAGPILNTGGGLITFDGAAYNEFSDLVAPVPGDCIGCNTLPAQSSQFDAGTFEFGAAAVVATPEPSYFLIVGLGIVLLSLVRAYSRLRHVRSQLPPGTSE